MYNQSHHYLRFVQWKAEDELFVGHCPDLFIGGVCHGEDEQEVYRELCQLVAQEVTDREDAHQPLPPKAALVSIPVAV
jgi:predicted RNase H-like HicB family nuclease